MIPTILAPSISEDFQKRLKDFDPKLKAVFNCKTERFEILRSAKGRWHWVIAVENENGSFRPLDERIFNKLYEIDVIARYGSIANYERYWNEKQKKWQDNRQKEMDYELRYDIKDDKRLWQRAVENATSGRINDPPKERIRKIISYPKGVRR